ncbi:unnamed protein product [Pieris brassicae]|uniref:C2H2-type domain-containing protein n=1 Tax=Pieris brassicae TaxID=7116 RepID=A0A9P0TR61_PIEBR|nr:unnamed protein product [Pieris brassicae]
MDCYVPNNPQFGGCCHSLCCDPLQPCSCDQIRELSEQCCQQENENCCPENGEELNALSESIAPCDVNLGDVNEQSWTGEEMGSFSLPSLELDPLPSLFPFSPCSGYNRNTGGECRERTGGEAADVLLSLKHAVVHSDCAEGHPQMMVNSGSGYPYYEHYAATPIFPTATMSVNVSMNMTMHGCQPDQLCSQVQWNQNAATPSVNVVYPPPQNIPTSYPSATYSFTADFRPPNQSDPLITASSTFKPVLQNTQKTPNYIFQQKPNFQKMGSMLKRSPTKIYQEGQKESGYLVNQNQMHPQEYGCPICDRRFSQSSSVTTHMRTHSGERPYQCRSCKKAFSDSSTLTKHLRIHSGEKPYQCKLCLLRFSQSGNLNRHMRVHGNMSGGMLG